MRKLLLRFLKRAHEKQSEQLSQLCTITVYITKQFVLTSIYCFIIYLYFLWLQTLIRKYQHAVEDETYYSQEVTWRGMLSVLNKTK